PGRARHDDGPRREGHRRDRRAAATGDRGGAAPTRDCPLMSGLRLACESANPYKAAEIAAILGDTVELLPRPEGVPDVIEDGETLLDNASLKARALCESTGVAAVADDTGLEVDALGGAPGMYSARYAGENATYADYVEKL